MSFGDLMSSGRGPGVIGMIMALVVLGGFGAIYVFVFDAELQGEGVSLESVVRNQTEEIDSVTHQIEMNKAIAAEAEAAEKQNAKIDSLAKQNEEDSKKIEDLRTKANEIKATVVSTTKAMNAYITEYRSHIRRKAVGEKIPELKLKSGEVYTDVEVRAVSEIGLEIRHPGGQGRIGFEKLAPEWQERFQFDPDEKAKALAREQAAQRLYETSIDNSIAAEAEAMADPATPQGAEQFDKAIREKTIELTRYKTELGRLQAEATKVETDDSINRGNGGGKLAHLKDIRTRMQATESKIYALAREIASLKTKKPR